MGPCGPVVVGIVWGWFPCADVTIGFCTGALCGCWGGGWCCCFWGGAGEECDECTLPIAVVGLMGPDVGGWC
jgi:hypothetical protein